MAGPSALKDSTGTRLRHRSPPPRPETGDALGNALGESIATESVAHSQQQARDEARRSELYGLAGNGDRFGDQSSGIQQWSDDTDRMISNGGSGREQALAWMRASTADAGEGLSPGAEMKPWVMTSRETATAWFASKVGDSRAGKVLTGAFDAWLAAPEALSKLPDVVANVPSGVQRLTNAALSLGRDLWNDPSEIAIGAIANGVDRFRLGFNRTVNGDGLAMGSTLYAIGTALIPLGSTAGTAGASAADAVGGAVNSGIPTRLYHYTNEAGMNGILDSGQLNPSLKALNPNDVRYGNGQYLSDIPPGTMTPAQLSRQFINNPFQGARYTNFVEIDTTGLDIIQGRRGVYVVPSEVPLDLTGRLTNSGKVGP